MFRIWLAAFDVAEQLQAPVFVLSDLDMGMNQWMSKPFQYPDTPMQRGKVLWDKDLEELKGNWGAISIKMAMEFRIVRCLATSIR